MTLPSVSTVEPFPNPEPAKELFKDGRPLGSNQVVISELPVTRAQRFTDYKPTNEMVRRLIHPRSVGDQYGSL